MPSKEVEISSSDTDQDTKTPEDSNKTGAASTTNTSPQANSAAAATPATEETKTSADSQPDDNATSKLACDGDSDSDADEERAKEIEERAKLKAETEQYKRAMMRYMYYLLAVEAAVCATLLSAQNNNNNVNEPYNFRTRTVDVVCLSVLRLFLLYVFVSCTVSWGNVKSYDQEKELHTIFNTDTYRYKLLTQLRGGIVFLLLTVWTRFTGLNVYHASECSAPASSPSSSSSQREKNSNTEERTRTRKLFDIQEFINNHSGLDAQDVADVWRESLWMFLFFIMTVCTTIVGIKIAFWEYSDGYHYGQHVLLFLALILLTHSQSFIIKKYIDAACKPENRYLNTYVHQHAMLKTRNRSRYSCRLCYTRPDASNSSGKLILKCLDCPQHRAFVCVKCWKKKSKEARLKQQQQEADDGGSRDSGSSSDDVTYYEYFSTLLRYHLPYLHVLFVGVAFMAITTLMGIVMPRHKGQLLDVLIAGDLDGFYAAVKLQLLCTVVNGVVNSISQQSMSRVSQQITCDLQKRMFSNLMAQDMVFFDDHTTGEISERMNWGLGEMLSPFQGTIRTFFTVIKCVGAMYMCLTISWRLTFLGLSTLGPMSYFMSLFSRWSWQRSLVQLQLQREMYAIGHQGFEHIRIIRAFAKEHEFVRYYSMLRQEAHETDAKRQLTQSVNGIFQGWFQLGSTMLLTYVAGMVILHPGTSSTLTVGLYITFETYWQQFYSTINGIKGMYGTYDHALFMAKKIFRTLEQKTKIEHLAAIEGTERSDEDVRSKLVDKVDGNIKFENVEFYYEASPNKLVLKGINVEFEKGKTTALVGRSGGGKSTIMHLILRFYDPTKGRITINGADLKQYNPYALRRQIALVSQDTELFSKSVEYNIGFGANTPMPNEVGYESSYNLEQVEYSAKLANAHKFVSDMEDKYETKMGTRAKRCSGGQKQRISIARMLMSQPSVMLLDEATSSLDAESEALVQAAMERESDEKKCTLVIVAHRLSTVVNADKICVVDDGAIVEQGTHEQLIEMQGIYASLVERQINLKTNMKKKLEQMKHEEQNKDSKGKKSNTQSVAEDADCDNIDKLIDQIKAEKMKKKTEQSAEANSVAINAQPIKS